MSFSPIFPRPLLDRVLGRADLLLFSLSAILTIDTLASGASTGVSIFFWWTALIVFFFAPYGLIMAELGAAWPAEGGVYVWVREAFGPRWGSLAAWFYWINNACWIPSVYLIFAGTFDSIFVGSGNVWFQAAVATVLTWLTVWLGIVRLQVSKWIPNLGAVVKVLIFLSLGVLGGLWIFSGRPAANELSLQAMLPRWSDSLAFLPVLVYNTLGFELMSSAGEEMRDPQRDIPHVILLSGLIVAVVYTLGILGILLAVPLGELSIVTGTWDALKILGGRWGGAGSALVYALGLGFLYACVSNVVTWSLGVNRVAAEAAIEGSLPRGLGRLHPRFHTPQVAFVVMGILATLLLVGNAILASSASNVFWMIFKLSGLCFLISYLLAFPAFLVLRYRQPERNRPYRLPGGALAAWAASAICFLVILAACILFFKPSPSSQAPVQEAWLLGAEALATLVAGLLLMPRRKSRPSSGGSDGTPRA